MATGEGRFFIVPQPILMGLRTLLFTGLALQLATTGAAQTTSRFASVSSRIPWSVDAAGVFRWGQEIYHPIGATIGASPAEVAAAITGGMRDVVLNLPLDSSDWNIPIAELEKAKVRYMIRLEGGSPPTRGILVDPAGYRVSGVTDSQKFVFPLADADSAVVLAADKVDGTVTQWDRVLPKDGVVAVDIKSATASAERVVLVFPDGDSYAQLDAWENFDRYRDRLLRKLKATKFGEGFRGLINPVGGTTQLPKDEPSVVPSSDFYRIEMARFLDHKYRSLDTALRAWGIPASFNISAPDASAAGQFKSLLTFADVARLVPLWRGQRGVSRFYDPVSNRMIEANNRQSAAWADIAEVIRRASITRFTRLSQSIRTAVDVPVLQEWSGWSPVTESPDIHLTGMAVTAEGAGFSDLVERGARAASTALRWEQPGLLVASDIRLKGDQWSQAGAVADDLESMGMRGVFFRADSPAAFAAIKAQQERLSAAGPNLELPRALFFPENASEPAQAQRLPGGFWWLPSPAQGNRIDIGSHFFAYRTQTKGRNQLFMWTDVPGRVKLFVTKPDLITIRNIDGSDPAPKKVKGGLEMTMGQLPSVFESIDELPIPEPALQETMGLFKALNDRNKTLKRDITEELLAFQTASQGMDRNPSGSYVLLRQVLRNASLKIGDTSWIEAESSKNNSFSEYANLGGCSGGAALTLSPRLANATGFFAEYSVSVRYYGIQNVWIAARIPANKRGLVTLTVGGQTLTLPEQPTAFYGQGFAWYKLGTTRLSGNLATARIDVTNALFADMAFDAIVFTPENFSPRGLTLPPVSPLVVAAPEKNPTLPGVGKIPPQ